MMLFGNIPSSGTVKNADLALKNADFCSMWFLQDWRETFWWDEAGGKNKLKAAEPGDILK